MMKALNQLLNLVTTPGRYLPLELGAWKKPLASARLKAALAFPDLYEVGMSHLGVQILYHLLNSREDTACDRAYAPGADLEALLRERGAPLCGHESGAPLSSFDLLGFSLTYELCYTNVLNMLELAGIPLLAAEREDGWPLVIGGGPCTANPEPVAPFFDAFLFGEGEEAVMEIADAVLAWKEGGGPKSRLLESLARIEGVYIPSFFEPEYQADGRIQRIRARLPGYDRVRRRIVADLERAFFPERPLVPLIEPVHDRVMIEIARGCSRGCRFCQAGMIYRPVRERSSERVLELARRSLAATGYEECSLLALSAGDYSCLPELLSSLIREHYAARVSVSLPSLRVQGLTDPALRAIETVRKTGFTLAPEAGSDRLRRVINKDYTDQDLMETAERVFRNGWRNLKLYFMIGLPTETDEDIEEIGRLARRVAGVRAPAGRPQVSPAVSGFVPKSHTPFQWEPQADPGRLREVQDKIRRDYRARGQKVKWQNVEMTEIEGLLARGDRRLAAVVREVQARGARMDGWHEHFDYGRWREALAGAGLEMGFYTTRERGPAEVLPWDHLHSGTERSWLWSERERSRREETTPDCREAGCGDSCGVCDHDRVGPVAAPAAAAALGGDLSLPGQPEVFFRYRVRYARRGDMRFMGQLEVTRLFNRSVRRAGLAMRYTQGHHPQPRVMFGPAPPVGVASEAEYVELELNVRTDPSVVRERLDGAVPAGIVVLAAEEVSFKAPAISSIITGFDYEARPGSGTVFDPAKVESFLDLEGLMLLQKREKGDREVDVRSRVKYLMIGESGELKMGLKVVEGPGVKPHEVVQAVFGFADDDLRQVEMVRIDTRFAKPSPVRYPGRSERTRRPGPGRRGPR